MEIWFQQEILERALGSPVVRVPSGEHEKLEPCEVSPVLHQVICDSQTTLYTAHPIDDSHHAHHVSFFTASKFIHGDQVCSM